MTETAQAEWARCRGWIADAVAYCGGTHTVDDVWSEVCAGEAQFWPGERSAMVTNVVEFPRAKALHFWLCGGELEDLLVMLPQIEAWGAQHGCSKFTTAGRSGWRRVLKSHGYRELWNVCAKDHS